MKRAITLTILAAILISAASCGGTQDEKPTTTAAEGDTTTSEPDDGFVKDELPELNYNGDEVRWFCGDYASAYFDDIYAENQNGSLVNDAVYNARLSVEERLKIKLSVERYEFVWANVPEYNSLIKSMIMSGDTTYDAYIGYTLVPLIIEGGCFSDLAENKYLDLGKPWWNQDCRNLMPGDSVWFVTGDATMSLIKHSLCVYFNQNLLDSCGVTDNMYDIVRNGKWTLDKLESIIKDTYSDLNGNSASDNEDRFGLTFGDENKLRMVSAALDVNMYTKTKDGYDMTFISERTNDVFTRMQKLITANENVRQVLYNDPNGDSFMSFGGNSVSKIFTSGNSLFTASLVGDAAAVLDNSQFTVGMIPFPKYDEKQDDYYTSAQRFAHIYIPSTVTGEQNDRAGAVLEAWASECYRSVMPTYFETSLKTRYSNDNDMAEMFDLLRKNTKVEFGTVFYSQLALNCDTFKKLNDSSYNFTSESESLRSKTETQLGELITALTGK